MLIVAERLVESYLSESTQSNNGDIEQKNRLNMQDAQTHNGELPNPFFKDHTDKFEYFSILSPQ